MEDILPEKRKGIKSIAVLIACLLAIVLLRLLLDQWQGYSKGMDSLNKGDYKETIMYFDRVLNAHIPFSPLEGQAKKHLLDLAARFENGNEPELALLCYETVRTSRYLTRHLWVPDSRGIPFLNHKIATIKASLLVKDGMVKDFKEGYDQQMGIMGKDFSPSVFWSLVAVAAFCAYIVCIVLWILRRRGAFIYCSFLSFVLWIAALHMA